MQNLEMTIWFWYWQDYQPLGIKNAKQNMKGNIMLVNFSRISLTALTGNKVKHGLTNNNPS